MSADVRVNPFAVTVVLATPLLGPRNGVGATHTARELRKRRGTETVSPSLLTQDAEPPVLRLTVGGDCWSAGQEQQWFLKETG